MQILESLEEKQCKPKDSARPRFQCMHPRMHLRYDYDSSEVVCSLCAEVVGTIHLQTYRTGMIVGTFLSLIEGLEV